LHFALFQALKILTYSVDYQQYALIFLLFQQALCKQCEGIDFYCHDPIVIRDENANLDTLIKLLRANHEINSDTPIEKDVVIVWTANYKRIITGADILGRLLKGI